MKGGKSKAGVDSVEPVKSPQGFKLEWEFPFQGLGVGYLTQWLNLSGPGLTWRQSLQGWL